MNFLPLLVCAAMGLGTTLMLVPIIRRWRERAVAAALGGHFHHTHKTPVSRLGGLALAGAFGVVALAGYVCFAPHRAPVADNVVIVVSSLAMFGLGFWDDLRPLGARKKLVGQILISTAVCCFGVQIGQFKNPLSGEVYHLGAWAVPVTVFWLVALTNIVNLIDGVDGLAGGIALMLMGLLTFVGLGSAVNFPTLCAAGMFGALLGFLRYNFPPAKIYMGDGGAYFLGFLIGILTLVNSQKGTILAALIAPVFALALPILDVSLTILRRALKGLPIFRADRNHLHHKLLAAGLTRTRAVLLLYAISSVCLLMAFGVFWSQGRLVPIFFGFLCLLLLFSARSFNFSRDWFSVGRVLADSLAVRKDSQYALCLSRWLELEGGRAATLDALWEDYVFAVRKLGFARVELRMGDETRVWQSPVPAEGARALRCEHELNLNGGMTVAFDADGQTMSPRLFQHLSELAAEGWLRAATRWQAATKLPLRFNPPVPQLNGFARPWKTAVS
jgi:UDP-GlcNAc:undecaprenyl-phosphate GlcNAc-1-phosphate transferase